MLEFYFRLELEARPINAKSGLTAYEIMGYLLAYLGWIVTGAASMLAIFLMRNSFNLLWPLMGGNRWSLRALDQFGMVILIVAWLAYVILTEHYYRATISRARDRRLERMLVQSSAPDPSDGTRTAKPLEEPPLRLLLHRFMISAAFPAGLLALHLAMRGAILILLRR